jgi:hypothetical protein
METPKPGTSVPRPGVRNVAIPADLIQKFKQDVRFVYGHIKAGMIMFPESVLTELDTRALAEKGLSVVLVRTEDIQSEM